MGYGAIPTEKDGRSTLGEKASSEKTELLGCGIFDIFRFAPRYAQLLRAV